MVMVWDMNRSGVTGSRDCVDQSVNRFEAKQIKREMGGVKKVGDHLNVLRCLSLRPRTLRERKPILNYWGGDK